MAAMDLLIATRNTGKIPEIAHLLEGVSLNFRSLKDYPGSPSPEETGDTFEENAAIKATAYGRSTGLLTLADDSGLEVEALRGAPGVLSARYAGPSASAQQRVSALLDALRHCSSSNRDARFVSVVALFEPATGNLTLFRGVCGGTIALAPRGDKGFGYDPVFIPEGYEQTFAELSGQVKQRISHRARAMENAREYLLEKFCSGT